MNKYIHSTILFLFLFTLQNSFAQCPGCVIDLPTGLGEDTIYLTSIPDGEAGQYYEEDMSFRLPKTTTPVNATDPDVPAGLNISEITITSLVNIPPGLEWTASQTTFVTDDETDGCIRLCGTPLVADTFEIDVNIDAVVFGLTQNTSFTVVMVINPAISTSEGFSMSNNVGCGSTTVSFFNNVPSDGNTGLSYTWDFGNGVTSTDENPVDQVYTMPGEYIVEYEATVDTNGYFLQGVTVIDSSCDDIFNTPPDMKIKVFNPDGSLLFQSGTFTNTWPPVSVSGFYTLGDGEYFLEVIDDDLSGDDICGTYNFDKFDGGDITLGDFSVNLDILHPVTIVNSVDTVIVYEEPEMPVITSVTGTEFIFCEGTDFVLNSSYADGNQWYFNGNVIPNFTENSLTINSATSEGFYAVAYTDMQGCTAFSAEVEVIVIPAPATPAFINDNNLLTMFDVAVLPDEYSLQWYQDGVALVGETDLSYCITAFADYGLEVLDLETGCFKSFTQTVPFNANGNCTTATADLISNFNIKISPNPTSGRMFLSMNAIESGDLSIRIQDLQGRTIFVENNNFSSGAYRQEINITGAASGLYVVQIQIGAEIGVEKIVVR